MNASVMRCPVSDSGVDAERYEIRTGNSGAMDTMPRERSCSLDFCKGAAVAVLAQQNLCLNHLLSYSYEHLERLDPRSRRNRDEAVDIPTKRSFVEECSRAALDVSLRSESLTNLQRARLLDIMMWAGELFLLLRVPRAGQAHGFDSHSPFAATGTILATPKKS